VAGYVLFLARWPAPRMSFPGPAERPRLLAGAGLLVAYYVLAPVLGYTASTRVVSTGLYRAMGGYRWWLAGLLGGATTGALYLVFRVWLSNPCPRAGWTSEGRVDVLGHLAGGFAAALAPVNLLMALC
jgi:hypothetical protein